MARRQLVARLVLDGVTKLRDLAARVGLANPDGAAAQMTVSRDLKVLYEEWKQSAARDFAALKAREQARLERQYRRWLHLLKKSARPVKKRRRKFDWVVVSAAVAPEPEVRTDDGVLIREATAGKPAVYQRVLVEEEVRYEEGTADPRWGALMQKCSEDLCQLLGLVTKTPGDLTSAPPVVQFLVVAPTPAAGQVGPVPVAAAVEDHVAETTPQPPEGDAPEPAEADRAAGPALPGL